MLMLFKSLDCFHFLMVAPKSTRGCVPLMWHAIFCSGLVALIVFGESFLSQLVQEPSSHVVPGLRYEDNEVALYNSYCTWVDQ